jgi:hypothetical protein
MGSREFNARAVIFTNHYSPLTNHSLYGFNGIFNSSASLYGSNGLHAK